MLTQPKTYVALVLDKSGSMGSVARAVIDAYNSQLNVIRDKAEDQDVRVSLYTFGSRVSEDVYDTAPKNIKPLTLSDYNPSGQTALYDAIFEATRGFANVRDRDEASFLIVVMTDGEENNSKNVKLPELQQSIARHQRAGNWTFVFQVPPGTKQRFVRDYGVPSENVREWEATTRGVVETSAATVTGLDTYFTGRSQGLRSVESFYVRPDLGGLKSTTVKKQLRDISHQFDAWSVSFPEPIKECVERLSGRHYALGSAYYELTKTETVQAGKQILLREKNSNRPAVYGGHEARELVGLPLGASATVTPGNHGNYDLFIQSTSTNRKLIPGTRLLVQR